MSTLSQARCMLRPSNNLGAILAKIAERRRNLTRFDQGTWESIHLCRPSLPDLSVFEASPMVGVDVQHSQKHLQCLDLFFDFIAKHSSDVKNVLLHFTTTESQQRIETDHFDLCVLVGWREGQYFCGFSLGAKSPGFADLAYRRHLFTRIFSTAGLSNEVFPVWDKDKLFVRTAPGSHLTVVNMHACTDGSDPLAFNLHGFPDLPSARVCFDRLIGPVIRTIDELLFFAALPFDLYEPVHHELNAVTQFWEVGLYGALIKPVVEGLKTLSIPPTIGRVPLFEWCEKRDEVFYQGDVVNLSDGVALEVTSNCESMDYLLKRLRESTDMEFTPIAEQEIDV